MNSNSVKIVPLGGLGRIGGNMMVLETERDLIVIDCGMLFPGVDQPGVDYLAPDPAYVAERFHKLRAYVITHGHEDHIGAIAETVATLPAPIYATKFTHGLMENKFGDRPDVVKPDFHTLRDNVPVQIGDFHIEPIPVTHSIADAVALAIRTPAGLIVHTGDFKLDPTPIDGRLTDMQRFRALGDEGVVALLSDSTNAERPGRTWSELEVSHALHRIIAEAPNRVIVTTFSSNIHRVQAIVDASVAAGRTVIPVGRSVVQNIQMALERGFLKAERGAIADVSYYESIPRSHVTVIASGSQGEPQASMTRIANGSHPYVKIDPDDRVIWSSRRIPGNEIAIGTVINNLLRAGIDLVDDHVPFVHTSGHAFADELADVISAVRPRFFIPVHGEYRHMRAHAKIAERLGIAPRDTFIIEDGHPLSITATPQGPVVRHEEQVHAGYVFVEGEGMHRVDEVVLRDRRILADTGIVVVIAVLDEIGALVSGPEFATRGVIHVDANAEMLGALKDEVTAALDAGELERGDDAIAEDLRLAVRRFFRRELGKKPIVVPMVMRI